MRRHTALLLFILVVAVGVLLSPRIGAAWDEPDNIFAAGQYINFFRTGDSAFLTRTDSDATYFAGKMYTLAPEIARYPPFPLYVGNIIVLIGEKAGLVKTSADIITAFHYATVLFFAVLVVYVYLFGELLGLGERGSIVAALFAFLYPALFGHGLSDLKDTAQVALFTASLYYLIRGKGRDYIIGAVIWGLALATKINAVYVPVIWGVWTLFGNRKSVKTYSAVAVIGVAIAVFVWPYLWFSPLAHIQEVLTYFTNVGRGYVITWNGLRYHVGSGISYWWYPLLSFLFMTPLELVALAGIGKKRALLLVWIAVPLLRIFWPWSSYYDYLRHFLEILPPVLLLAAFGIEKLGRYRTAVAIVILAHLAVINVVYFPYSTGYFTILAQHPNEKYDRDIEALSIREGIEYLHSKYPTITIYAPIGLHLSWYYLGPQDRFTYNLPEANFVLLPNKMSHVSLSEFLAAYGKDYAVDHVISRGNAIFGWILKKKGT